jgi:hypothetical protein
MLGGRSERVFTYGPSRRWSAIVLAAAALAPSAVVGCGGDSAEQPSTVSGKTQSTDESSASETRQRLDDLVRELLTKRGLDPAVIECALQRLSETISDAEIKAATTEIKRTGSPPATLIDAATEAGQQCAGN